MHSWNGLSLLHCTPTMSPDLTIYTDASGSWGCSACLGRQWLQWQWPPQLSPISIMAKELVPIVLNCAVWGSQLSRCIILFQCDKVV